VSLVLFKGQPAAFTMTVAAGAPVVVADGCLTVDMGELSNIRIGFSLTTPPRIK